MVRGRKSRALILFSFLSQLFYDALYPEDRFVCNGAIDDGRSRKLGGNTAVADVVSVLMVHFRLEEFQNHIIKRKG